VIVSVLFAVSCNEEISITPPNPRPQAGYIFVNSKPVGAEIYINGLKTGKITPDSITWLDSGNYKILLRLKGWNDYQIVTYLTLNEKKLFNIDFTIDPANYGGIYFMSKPVGANIFLNDSAIGKVTPLTITGLQPGNYKILVRKTDYLDDSLYVDVVSQKITEANIIMQDTIEMVIYNTDNSRISSNTITTIAVDNNNLKWIGTSGSGIVSFDGINFTTYDNTNSPIPFERISSIYVDDLNNKWIGTTFSGLIKYDNNSWMTYNSSNTNLPDDLIIMKVTGDNTGKIWIATFGNGLISFDGTIFTYFTSQNTGVPITTVNDITFDGNNNMWLALYGGIAKFDGGNWSFFNKENSGIPNDAVAITKQYNNDIYAGFRLTKEEGDAGYQNCYVYLDFQKEWYLPPDTLQIGALYSLYKDIRRNFIWATSNWGFQYFDRWMIRESWTMRNSNLPDNDITAFICDKNDRNIRWIGTQLGGLVKFKKHF